MRHVLLGLLLAIILTTPAQAFSVSGGTAEQQAWAREVMQASNLDLEGIDAAIGIEVIFAEVWDPYWDISSLPTAVGLAYSDGRVVVDSQYPVGFDTFGSEILAHEYAHTDWFVMGRDRREDWAALVGGDGSDWWHNSTESYAEHAKLYSWPPEYLSIGRIRSDLTTLTRQEWETWRYGFSDIAREDPELRKAAWWAKDNGLIKGYEDGTLGPYKPLLRRHVDLIVQRWRGKSLGWTQDYAPATRADVRDAIPDLEWREARWAETLNRSQMLRLMYRKTL